MRRYLVRWVLVLLLFVLPGPATGQTDEEIEDLFWRSVVCEREVEVRLYLEEFPNGAYVADARACLERQLGLDRAARVLVQRGLAALDYSPGPADGLFGEETTTRTRRAIRAWQAAKGMEASGYLTREQAETLMEQGREEEQRQRAEEQRRQEAAARAEAARQRQAQEEAARAEAARQRQAQEAAAPAEAARQRQAQEAAARAEAERRRQEAERQQQPRELRNSIGMEFVLIPAGEFEMGSPSSETGRSDNEGPVHRVTISQTFYLGKYEVTQEQWEAVMGSNPSYFFRCGSTCPVEQVSWEDVQGFIEELNQREGVGRYRLPTEAEWEYAARAGTQTAYHFGNAGNRLGLYGWYDDNSGGRPHPVGGKRPNAWGLSLGSSDRPPWP